jgi:hypothetical protein
MKYPPVSVTTRTAVPTIDIWTPAKAAPPTTSTTCPVTTRWATRDIAPPTIQQHNRYERFLTCRLDDMTFIVLF